MKKNINTFKFIWFDKYYAQAFSVYCSNDKVNWIKILSDTKTSNSPNEYLNLNLDYQYTALLCTKKNSVAIGLAEFEVYQRKLNQTPTPTVTPTPLKTPTPTATAINCPLWSYPVAYKVNDCVTYKSIEYKCTMAHTSNEAWTPDVTTSLWMKK